MKTEFVLKSERIELHEMAGISGGSPGLSSSFYYDLTYILGLIYSGAAQTWEYYSYGGLVAF